MNKPVAWCLKAHSDGSYGEPVVFVGDSMFTENLAKANKHQWIVHGAGKLVPLYAAPVANERIAAQSAELTAIDDVLGTNEGHSAVDHILALKERLERLLELARAVTDWPPDMTAKIKALRAEIGKER